MSEDRPISEAYFLAVSAIGDQVGKPLPKGINRATVGDWKLTLNASLEPVKLDDTTTLPAFELLAENTVYVAFATFGPYGGMIGGMTEDRFIADMKAGGGQL